MKRDADPRQLQRKPLQETLATRATAPTAPVQATGTTAAGTTSIDSHSLSLSTSPEGRSALDTAVQRVHNGVVQWNRDNGPPTGRADVVQTAARGVSGSGGALPHGARIQQSFGQHDVSAVQAHSAPGAAKEIGARAYAMGEHVAFGDTPDLHTAAHEAAHVVQQRGGVQLKGSVGESGDRYEQHADAVADAVVGGRSAEALLDPFAGSGVGGGVQSKALQLIDIPAHIAQMDIAACQALAAEIFSAQGTYASRGLLNHKADAADDMKTELNRGDPPPITEQLALLALQVGVAAGAAALTAGSCGALTAAAVSGGAAVIAGLPALFGGGENEINATMFVSNYIAVMRTQWPQGEAQLRAGMTTEDTARQAAAELYAIGNDAAHAEAAKQVQRAEVLDEWMTATANVHGGEADSDSYREGMGDTSYNDASEGRLHLSEALISTHSWRFVDPTTATMEGVRAQDVRNYNLDRPLQSIRCPRTLRFNFDLSGWATIGVNPSNAKSMEWDSDESLIKTYLASYYLERRLDRNDWGFLEGDHDGALIEANWSNGMNKIWDQVKDRSLRDMNISSVGN